MMLLGCLNCRLFRLILHLTSQSLYLSIKSNPIAIFHWETTVETAYFEVWVSVGLILSPVYNVECNIIMI